MMPREADGRERQRARRTSHHALAARRRAALASAVFVLLLGGWLAGCGDGSGGPPMACNGHRELCDRPFDQVAFAGAHNAMSNQDEGWIIPNQIHGLERQLEDGVRVFLLDTHDLDGEAYLCHTLCDLGKERLVDALVKFRVFMESHPNEVLAFVVEDGISSAETERAFTESGLVEYVYVHPPGAPWPTLGTMIEDGTRLLVMAERGGPPPAWYHQAYELSWDTPYAFETEADFSCALNRGRPENDLFQVNHWLSNPLSKPENGEQVNVFDVLWPRVERCRMEAGRIPNFVVVDYYNIGDLFRVVDRLNGL